MAGRLIIINIKMQKSKIKAIIFDMDGVLIDSEHWWQKFEHKFFASILKPWNKETERNIEYDIMGRGLKDIHQVLRDKYGLKMTWPALRTAFDNAALDIYLKQCKLMPGVLEVLDYLKKKGIKTALASSSFHSWIKMMLNRFELKKYFDAIVSSQDVGSRSKPAPDIYLYTAKKLKLEPQDCLVVEDSQNGILSAKRAGMKVVGYRSKNNQGVDLGEADVVIGDLRELNLVV